MINPNTTSEVECRDWLARNDGWVWRETELRTYPHWTDEDGEPCLDAEGYDAHPYPSTLDSIATAMPPGWKWFRDQVWTGTKIGYPFIDIEDTGDELLDRARLAVACWQAEENKPST